MATIFGGPRTQKGKAIAARNATTHGLFSRNVVLPHLGEDPRGYQELFELLQIQINPRTAAELYYVERVTEATWQMRRLARWEAQIWENDGLDEDQRLTKLERVSKLQTTLERRVDRAFGMLARTMPRLTQDRVQEDFLHARGLTHAACKQDPWQGRSIEREAREHIYKFTLPEVDFTLFDNVPTVPQELPEAPAPAESPAEHEKCQNELPCDLTCELPVPAEAAALVTAEVSAHAAPEPEEETKNSQNEPPLSFHERHMRALAEDPGCGFDFKDGVFTLRPSRRAHAKRSRDAPEPERETFS